MWLFNSSIGKKVVMSVTGIALILFLTFHCCMNVVALFSGEAYNMICELLGANWYAVAATLGLAALAAFHIVYAFILTMQNRRARGTERYAVTEKPAKVEWASQNMLVLGIIILLGLLLQLLVQHDVCRAHGYGHSAASRRWFRLHQADILQLVLCHPVHHLDCGHLVPPLSWFLECHAHAGLER